MEKGHGIWDPTLLQDHSSSATAVAEDLVDDLVRVQAPGVVLAERINGHLDQRRILGCETPQVQDLLPGQPVQVDAAGVVGSQCRYFLEGIGVAAHGCSPHPGLVDSPAEPRSDSLGTGVAHLATPVVVTGVLGTTTVPDALHGGCARCGVRPHCGRTVKAAGQET